MINPLQPGDWIALIAPSSPFEREPFLRACDGLEDLGYRLAPGKSIHQKRGYLAGTEAERAQDLIRAISTPEVSAIICIRGGYGSSRLLPWLPFADLRHTPKILLGYSDATCLHAAFESKMGWTTFHGPNLIEMADTPGVMDGALQALAGCRGFSWSLENHQVLRPGLATGPLLGGNLTCLCHLLGTPYFPNVKGALLLLEDRGEALYRLDRALTQLKLAGVFDQIGGLLLGHFQDCDAPQKVGEMVLDLVRSYSFPVLAGLPFGHGSPNQVIPLGPSFALNAFEGTFKIVRNPFVTNANGDGAKPAR
jgi:muramoyltetrapeptide carboxypeptidase